MLLGLWPTTCLGQRQHCVVRHEVCRLCCLIEWIGPPAFGRFIFVKLVNERTDLCGVFLSAHLREKHDLPTQVDYIFGLVGQRQLQNVVAFSQPILLVGLSVRQVESVPTLRCDLERADVGLAAVCFISRYQGHAFVMDLEKTTVRRSEEHTSEL